MNKEFKYHDSPILRFKEFNKPWERKLLSKYFPKIRNGFVGTATPYYVENGIAYLQGKNIKKGKIDISGLIFVNEEFHQKQFKSQLVKNDILMVQSGHVGECAVVDEKFNGANCHALIVMTPNGKVSSTFFVYYFYSQYGKREINKIKTGNTVEHILTSELKRLYLYSPKYEEQQKIAAFLSAVDDKLTSLSRKRELLEIYKRGLMQQLFSQQIRFKQDDGSDFPDWEEKKLDEVATFLKGKEISKMDISHDGITECIRYGELYTVYGETIDKVVSKTNLKKSKLVFSKANDVIIPASGETRIDIATAACVIHDGIALGGDLNIIRSKLNGVFLSFYLNSFKKKQIARMAQGISVMHLYSSQLKSLKIDVPHFDEQQKIANFLQSIDNKIDAVAKQVNQLDTFKKGLLQKLFV